MKRWYQACLHKEEFVFNHRLYLDKSGKVLEQSASMPQSYGDMIKNMRGTLRHGALNMGMSSNKEIYILSIKFN